MNWRLWHKSQFWQFHNEEHCEQESLVNVDKWLNLHSKDWGQLTVTGKLAFMSKTGSSFHNKNNTVLCCTDIQQLTLLSFSSAWHAWQNLKPNQNSIRHAVKHHLHLNVTVDNSYLSPWMFSTGLSIKAWRGKRWWKDLARWGADTRVKPWR